MKSALLILCVSIGCFAARSDSAVNNRPVIGILSLDIHPWEADFPANVQNYTSYIASSYVKWAEMSGARVVPLILQHSFDDLKDTVSKLNGVLFTGGTSAFYKNGPPDLPNRFFAGNDTNSTLSTYAQKGCAIFEQIKEMNNNGTHVPLWGTCLGYELLNVCVRPENTTVQDYNGEPPYTHIQTFEKSAQNARLFNELGQTRGAKTMQQYATKKVALFNHHHGVSPDTYNKYPVLPEFFNILSTSIDYSNVTYISLIESQKYPIYGSQFHPEKNIFEWNATVAIPHDQDSIEVTTYLTNFFIHEARKNNNTFGSEEDLQPYLIYNYDPVYIDGYFATIYVF